MDYEIYEETIRASLKGKHTKLHARIDERDDGYYVVIQGVTKGRLRMRTLEKTNEKHGPYSTFPAAKQVLIKAMQVNAHAWQGGSHFEHDVNSSSMRSSST